MNNSNIDHHDIQRIQIIPDSTPIEKAINLSQALDIEVYIKRDDCTGLGGGGNKIRKLEYLLADAKKNHADTLVTIGGLQSNHARQTAAVAAKYGLRCELVLEDISGTPKGEYYHNGNVLLDNLFGAKIHTLARGQDIESFADDLMQKLKKSGAQPYFIPVGGSNVIGSYGYVRCAHEILQQLDAGNIEVDQIILASGSAGTQAGLLAGLISANLDVPVLGICVSRTAHQQQLLVEKLLRDVLKNMRLNPDLAKNKVQCNGNYVGKGYGIVTRAMIHAVKKCAQMEGLLLDPVYSGKAMAGLIDLSQKGVIAKGSGQLFLHTGGAPALFAYQDVF